MIDSERFMYKVPLHRYALWMALAMVLAVVFMARRKEAVSVG
jgi:hypothetical protein